MEIRFESSLPPEALLTRLKEGADSGSFFAPLFSRGKKPFYLTASKFDVSIRKKIFYRNSFQTLFVGTIRENGRGSVIEGVFRMNRLVYIFLTIWFGFTGSFAVTFYSQHLVSNLKLNHYLWLQPIGMMLFAVALTYFGKWLGRDEPRFITAYIRACCDNKDFDPGSLG